MRASETGDGVHLRRIPSILRSPGTPSPKTQKVVFRDEDGDGPLTEITKVSKWTHMDKPGFRREVKRRTPEFVKVGNQVRDLQKDQGIYSKDGKGRKVTTSCSCVIL